MTSDPNSDAIASRIQAIEIALVHQQRFTEQLNEVVTQQSSELFRLQRLVDVLQKQVLDLKKRPSIDEAPPTLEEEKPPHY